MVFSSLMPSENRVFNFSSGPAMLPEPVLIRTREEMLSHGGSGMSVMEMSHRSSRFGEILDKAESGLRTILSVPDAFRILFIQGGGALQFSLVPMNFLAPGDVADYIVTGHWGTRAVAEAAKLSTPRVAYSSESSGFSVIPRPEELSLSDDAKYTHYVANETIEGIEFPYDLDGRRVPVVCDMSSNILSRSIDWTKYSLIYAGAQKNIGPSGVAVLFIRDEMLDKVRPGLPSVLDYRSIAENRSMVNTPNTWAIYMIGLVCDWIADEGGLAEMERRAAERSSIVYEAIDSSQGFYRGHAATDARSRMNVTFRLADEQLTEKFCSEAEHAGLDGLRGHRSVGGVRASIYNAFPLAGIHLLRDFMADFALRTGTT
jgi:phosphoserine aminotransferase